MAIDRLKGMVASGKSHASAVVMGGAGKVRAGAEELTRRLARYKLLFDKGTSRPYDEIFFTAEDLPPLGKEYWFMVFVEPGGRMLTFTFGRASSSVNVEGKTIPPNSRDKVLLGGFCHDGSFSSFPSQIAKFENSQNSLSCRWEGREMSFQGSYPSYSFSISDLCDVELSKPERGVPYETYEFMKGLVATANLYFNFSGSLKSRPWEGKCYIQKVIATSPFAPWRWGLLYFRDGSSLRYFSTLAPLQRRISYKNDGLFYHAPEDRLYRIGGFSLAKVDDHQAMWLFSSNDGEVDCSARLKTRASNRLRMQSMGEFTYLQYPTDVEDFFFQSGDLSLDLSQLGKGSGITEDTFGLML